MAAASRMGSPAVTCSPPAEDLRDQFCWKVKPVGLDPKGSIPVRPLHPSVACVRLHDLVARPCGAQYRRSSHRASLPISTGMPPKPLMLRSRSGARAGAEDFCAAKNRTIIPESTRAQSEGSRACHRRRTNAVGCSSQCTRRAEHDCYPSPAAREVAASARREAAFGELAVPLVNERPV